jgi:hypothetical protein
MSKTAVGLFEHSGLAHQVVQDLETSAFPRGEIRILRRVARHVGRRADEYATH